MCGDVCKWVQCSQMPEEGVVDTWTRVPDKPPDMGAGAQIQVLYKNSAYF